MKTILTALLLGMSLFLAQASFADQALKDAFKGIAPSVGALYTINDNGDLKFICTTTVVESESPEERAILLSAGHCAGNEAGYFVSFNGTKFHPARVWKLPKDVHDRSYKRPFGEPKVDMAFFRLLEDVDVVPLQLGSTKEMEMGQDVVTVGFPLGVTKIGYEGTLAGKYNRPTELKGYLMLQIFGAPGSSGSSIVDLESGRVVGVLVSGKQGRVGLPVLFATPIEYEKYLVDLDAENQE